MLKIEIMTAYLQIFFNLNNFFNIIYLYGIVLLLTIKHNLRYRNVVCNLWSSVRYSSFDTPDTNCDFFKKIRNFFIIIFMNVSPRVISENIK